MIADGDKGAIILWLDELYKERIDTYEPYLSGDLQVVSMFRLYSVDVSQWEFRVLVLWCCMHTCFREPRSTVATDS